MQHITEADYLSFLARQKTVLIGLSEIRLRGPQRPKILQPPDDWKTETTTRWSFEKWGNWATHKAGFRGNWAP